jgi:hypothetical protein
MSTTRALLFNDADAEFLFMIRTPDGVWHADLTMLDYWRNTDNTPAQLNIYAVTGAPDTFVAMNHIGAPTELHVLPPAEYDAVRSLVVRPWISNKRIYMSIPLGEIAAFDAWIRDPLAIYGTVPPHWEDHARPLLADVPQRDPWIPYLLTLPPPPPPPPQPQPTTHTLPPHVIAAVIRGAVAAGATCPITMEPIQTATATVTACGHVFTATALQRWLSNRRHCPECRAALTA